MSRKIGSNTPTSLSFISKVQLKEEINPHAVKKMFDRFLREELFPRSSFARQDRFLREELFPRSSFARG